MADTGEESEEQRERTISFYTRSFHHLLGIQACKSASLKPLVYWAITLFPFIPKLLKRLYTIAVSISSLSPLWNPSLPGFPLHGEVTSDGCLAPSNLVSFLISSGLSLTCDTVGHSLLIETLSSLSFHTAQFPGLSASLLTPLNFFYQFLFLSPTSVRSILVSVF